MPPKAQSISIAIQGALLIVLCLAFGLSATGIKIDDAYIFYTYIRNIADGYGWVFNRGEFVNGTTSALYPIAAAAFTKFGAQPEVAGHWLGVFGLGASLLILLRINSPWPAIPLLLPLIALNSRTLDDAVGMETYLTLGLILLTLRLYLSERLYSASTTFGLAVLSRPDSALFGIILAADYIFRHRRFPQLGTLLPFSVITGSWLLFSKFYFGALLPNTIGAKLAQSGHAYWGGEFGFLHGAARIVSGFGALSYLAAFGAVLAVIFFKDIIKNRAVFLLLVWGIAYFIVYAFIIKAPPYRWYYVPILVPFSILILLPMAKTPLPAQLVFAVLLGAGAIKLSMERNSAPVTLKFESYVAVADWINKNTPANTSVAAMEIGVIGYYLNNHRVIDALGLITPAQAYLKRHEHGWFIKEHHPDYVITNNPPRNILEEFTKREWFKNDYQLRTTITTPRNKRGVRIYEKRYQ
jgi:arabinofuranosyltransferase